MENSNYVHQVSYTCADGQTKISTVPAVQELCRKGIEKLPDRFILSCPPPPPALATSFPLIIDMAKLDSNSNKHLRFVELQHLACAATNWGLFFVVNHDVEPSLISSLSQVTKGFFELSFEEKKRSVGTYLDTHQGYGQSFVKSDCQNLNWFDRLVVRVHPNQDHLGRRSWPTNPGNFRSTVEVYSEVLTGMTTRLLKSLGESLGLEPDSFLKPFRPREDCGVNFRVNYYPPLPPGDMTASTLGLVPHSDSCAVTVIAQLDDVEGLEVLRPEGWVRIPALEGALLFMAGDLLEVMSNGRVESPWHRVAARGDRERYSVVWFYFPPENADVGPVESGGEELRYREVNVKEYIKNYYEVTPTKEKITTDFAKV